MSSTQLAGLMTIWLQQHVSPESVEALAKAIGYKTSGFFHGRERRTKFSGELVIIYVALAIFAVNQKCSRDESQAIIDPFLASARQSIFRVLEKLDSGFKGRYEEHIATYFKILHESQPVLGLTFVFMQSCGMDPLQDLKRQLFLADHFATALKTTLAVLDRTSLS